MELVYVEIEKNRQDSFARRMQRYAELQTEKEHPEKEDKQEGQSHDEL